MEKRHTINSRLTTAAPTHNSRFWKWCLIEGGAYLKNNVFDTKIDEKQHLAKIIYQELVKKKEKYSSLFELNNIVYCE